MSCTRTAARSLGEPVMAILNLRGRKVNSGCSVDHWRTISHQMARILDLVDGRAGKVVGGGVADAVAPGLDGVHVDVSQRGQRVRRVLELDPVELQVPARGEVAVAAVVLARDVGQLAQLARRQRAVGDGDAQHVGVELQVEPVGEAQRLELLFGELARDAAAHLVTELLDPLGDQRAVVVVVLVEVLGGRNGYQA